MQNKKDIPNIKNMTNIIFKVERLTCALNKSYTRYVKVIGEYKNDTVSGYLFTDGHIEELTIDREFGVLDIGVYTRHSDVIVNELGKLLQKLNIPNENVKSIESY